MPARKPSKRGRGRPPKDIDYSQVEKMAMMQFTDYEIAAWIEMEPESFCRRKKADDELSQCIKRGREKGKGSLRRMQYKAAEKGTPGALVWLGKQYLGQTDKQDVNQSGQLTVNIIKPDRSKDETGESEV